MSTHGSAAGAQPGVQPERSGSTHVFTDAGGSNIRTGPCVTRFCITRSVTLGSVEMLLKTFAGCLVSGETSKERNVA